MSRTRRQLEFLPTTDRLKFVTRQNSLFDGSRAETIAEHSWHVTLLALLYAEHAPPDTDLNHVLRLLVVHDLVEVYAGDHLVLTQADATSVAELEAKAAERLFGLLPEARREQFSSLWREFEERRTPEAKFAKAIDALHPLLMTWGPGDKGSSHHSLTAQGTLARKRPLLEPYPSCGGSRAMCSARL